ncbi:MAG: hypothetical protein ACXVDI_00720 [Ktedonobacterales bacterium]
MVFDDLDFPVLRIFGFARAFIIRKQPYSLSLDAADVGKGAIQKAANLKSRIDCYGVGSKRMSKKDNSNSASYAAATHVIDNNPRKTEELPRLRFTFVRDAKARKLDNMNAPDTMGST